MQADQAFPPSAPKRPDGRWLIILLIVTYACWVWPVADADATRERWKDAGIVVAGPPFMDLYLFPGSQATLARGGDPYVANPGDPWQRTYNYPRPWLWFMLFPADATVIAGIGLAMALGALGTWWLVLGRLTVPQGIVAGLLWCSPAVMLGVERGNTDLIIFALLAAAITLASVGRGTAGHSARGLWFLAAMLKLYPVLAWWAWWRQPAGRARIWLLVAAAVFAAYLLGEARETRAALSNTAAGWVLSYGARVPAHALAQAWTYYGKGGFNEVLAGRLSTGLAGLVVAGAWVIGRRWRFPAVAEEKHRLGLLAGGAIFLGTFLAGNSFNYRLIFLLLALPWLWRACGQAGPAGRAALAALLLLPLVLGFGYLVAGWPGFVLKELAGWGLLFCLAALLAAESAVERASDPAP